MKYRWLYVSLMVVLVFLWGFLAVIQLDLQRLARLQHKEKIWNEKIMSIKQIATEPVIKRNMVTISQTENLAHLATLVREQALFLQVINYTVPRYLYALDAGLAHLSVQGSFLRLARFLLSLQQERNMALVDYDLHAKANNNMLANLDIVIFKHRFSAARVPQAPAAPLHNFFCPDNGMRIPSHIYKEML